MTIEDPPTYDSPDVQRHLVVASGMLDLPWETRLSGLATYGSGLPFTIFGPSPPAWFEGRKDETFVLDLRFSKYFGEDRQFEFFLDGINLTDEIINPAIEQCECSTNFGQANNQVIQGRSFQIGARARW